MVTVRGRLGRVRLLVTTKRGWGLFIGGGVGIWLASFLPAVWVVWANLAVICVSILSVPLLFADESAEREAGE
ncbi:MAG TPA: hypothetical protein VFX61_05665 [Micromonosporaceae bacterium]|nr:hypothetical protein [Micromonosporaceae bacterium]